MIPLRGNPLGSGWPKESSCGVFLYSGGNCTSSAFVMRGKRLTTSSTIYPDGDELQVYNRGKAYDGGVISGGKVEIHSGGYYKHPDIRSDGSMYVYEEGLVNSAKLSGGVLVLRGGSAMNTSSNKGDFSIQGGNAENTTLTWATMEVSSGTATSTVVNQGGYLQVLSGGTATNVVQNGGYVQKVGDEAYITYTPNVFSSWNYSSAYVTVHSGTTAVNATVVSTASMYIYSGGSASSVTLSGGYLSISGGVASETTVSSGGNMRVSSGGTAMYTQLQGGTMLVVEGSASGTVFSGGYITLQNAQVSSLTLSNSSSFLSVSSGGTAIRTNITGGWNGVYSGGITISATLNSGGRQNVSAGGITTASIIEANGRQNVSSGGTAYSTTVSSGGSLVVVSGGTALSVTSKTGAVINSAAGAVITYA